MTLNRRRFIQTAVVGSAALSAVGKVRVEAAPGASKTTLRRGGDGGSPEHPNLLFLWTDQHRGDVLPAAGDRLIKAPSLKSLGERSFVFHRAYCSQPVCTPSRASILTGLWPHNHGSIHNNVPLRRELRTFVEYLPPSYATAYLGKWHLGDELNAQHGFHEWRSIEDIYWEYHSRDADRKRFSDYHHDLLMKGFPPGDTVGGRVVFGRNFAAGLPMEYTKAGYITREAERFLRRRRDGQPFVLSVNFLEPHSPTFGPLNELHEPKDIPTGPAFWRAPSAGATDRVHRLARKFAEGGYRNHPFKTEADIRRVRANYYGLVSMVDICMGRILRALEESGQADDTIVVYTSDHGDLCGDFGLMDKTLFYEGSARVPLMIHVPWLSQDQVDFHRPVTQVDLAPTLLELLGLGGSQEIDGRSRANMLRQPSLWQDEEVVVEWNDPSDPGSTGRSLVNGDGWKLNLYTGDRPELYHLSTDPGELNNLAGAPSQRDRFRHMADLLRAWQLEAEDRTILSTG